jgi:hypothetical protein
MNDVTDSWLRIGAALWVVLMAALAYTFSVWLCAAVLGGAALAHLRRLMAGALAVGLLTLSIPLAHADDQPYLTCLANGVPGHPDQGGQVGTNAQVIYGKLMATGMSRLQAAVAAACANMMLPRQ